MASKGLFHPAKAEWFPAFREEILGFKSTKWDDEVDAISLVGQLLDKMGGQRAPTEKPPRKIISTNLCTATVDDLFRDNERHAKRSKGRIWWRQRKKQHHVNKRVSRVSSNSDTRTAG